MLGGLQHNARRQPCKGIMQPLAATHLPAATEGQLASLTPPYLRAFTRKHHNCTVMYSWLISQLMNASAAVVAACQLYICQPNTLSPAVHQARTFTA